MKQKQLNSDYKADFRLEISKYIDIESKILFSIVVPVYNAQKSIRRMLESVLNQSYKNFELICINDGSTDESLKILKDFSKNDSRIKIVSQKNNGVSSARNMGISIAKGDRLLFMDADDTWEPQLLEDIKELHSDIIIFGYKTLEYGKVTSYLKPDKKISYDFYGLFKSGLLTPVWNKVYNLEFIKKENIRFKEELHYGEDLCFNVECFFHSKNFFVTERCYYNYYADDMFSVSKQFNVRKSEELCKTQKEFDRLLHKYIEESDKVGIIIRENAIHYCYSCFLDLFRGTQEMSYLQKKQYISQTLNNFGYIYSIADNKKLLGKSKLYNTIFAIRKSGLIYWSAFLFNMIKKKLGKYRSNF